MFASDTVLELNPAKTEITFTVSDPLHTVRGTFQPEVEVHGKIRIHGADHEMALHFRVGADGTASTHFTIPYVQWGMKNPSNFLLKVGDKVEIEVKTVLGR